jgi:hypothetical protein
VLNDERKLTILAGLGLVLAILAAYSNHFRNSFHFDDAHTIVNNAAIRELRNIPLFFRDATTFSALPSNQSYRPLVSTLLAIVHGRNGPQLCADPGAWPLSERHSLVDLDKTDCILASRSEDPKQPSRFVSATAEYLIFMRRQLRSGISTQLVTT